MTEKVTYELSLRDLMTRGLAGIDSKLGQLEKKLSETELKANKTKGVFQSLGAVWSAIAATGIAALGVETIGTAAKIESMSKAIVFASGSTEEGAKNLAFLKNITQTMPIDLIAAQEGFKTFSGAVMGSSLEGDKARYIFTQVSKAASVMGLTADDTKGIFLALGQMVSKGTVQAEELKGQLGERLPGAFQLAAKAMGMTTRELQDQMKAGAITADVLLPRLAYELDKTYTKGMAGANNSINANIVKLQNLKTEIIQGSIPAVRDFMSAVVGGAFSIRENFEPLGDFFGQITGHFGDLIGAFTRLFGLASGENGNALLTFFKVLATALQTLTLPIQLITVQIANLIDVLGSLVSFASGDGLNLGDLTDRVMKRTSDPFKAFKNIWQDGAGGNGAGGTWGGVGASMTSTPPPMLAGVDEKLKKQSESVSGGVPKVVNINIEALMKDVKNYFGSGGLSSTEGRNFLDDLQEGLNTIVTDVGIVAQYGR